MKLWSSVEKLVSATELGRTAAPPSLEQKESEPMAMLKRDEPSTTTPAPNDLLIGRGAKFEGKLTFEGTVRIDASFVGSIVTNDVLVVGEHARIDADITCGTILIHGEVNGDIKAKTAVEVYQTAKVRGELETSSLAVEKGALVQGSIQMETSSKAPPVRKASVPSPQTSPVEVDTVAVARAAEAKPAQAPPMKQSSGVSN